jgi:outer membrane protein
VPQVIPLEGSDMSKPILLVPLLLLLSACSMITPTNPYKPVTLSSGQIRAAKAQSASYVDQLKEPLSLKECIDLALTNNPEVAAASKDIEMAGAQLDAARAGMWPKLNAAGGYTRYLDDIRLVQAEYNNQPGVFTADIFNADLILTMPLFTGGRVTNEISATDLLRQASERKLAFTREELVYNTSSIYFAILAQKHVVSSLEFSRDALAKQVKRINDMIAAQKAARVDMLRTEVRVADLDQKLTQERSTQAIAQRALANLMGVEPAGVPVMVGGDLTIPEGKVDASEHLAHALDKRQDYLAARSSLEAQAKRVDAARSGYFPTVSLKGVYGERVSWDASDKPNSGSNDNGTSRDVGSVGIVIDFPLFDAGLTEARVREENAKLAAAQHRLRKLELQIHLDVETAALNLESAQMRVTSTQAAIDQAKESLRIEVMKYDLSKGLIVDILDAQSSLLQAEVGYYRALADYHTAEARLRFAAGGDV